MKAVFFEDSHFLENTILRECLEHLSVRHKKIRTSLHFRGNILLQEKEAPIIANYAPHSQQVETAFRFLPEYLRRPIIRMNFHFPASIISHPSLPHPSRSNTQIARIALNWSDEHSLSFIWKQKHFNPILKYVQPWFSCLAAVPTCEKK